MSTIPITTRGAEKLKAELHRLKTKERPEVINAIEAGVGPVKAIDDYIARHG